MLVLACSILVALVVSALYFVAIIQRSQSNAENLKERYAHAERRVIDVRSTLEQQGRLMKEVAHELKNPIAAIVCAADSLEFLLKDRLREADLATIRHMKAHGEYVLRLMTDFIDLTRGLSGNLQSRRQAIYLNQMLDSVVGLLQPSAGARGVAIEVACSEGAVWVEVDPKHLKQILFNVVQNSIKFTAAGGKVTVSFGIGPDSESVSIEVRDTGSGIPQQELQHIFDPLWQLERRRPPDEAGSGLGLALTKALIELEGGGIFVESEEGQGTTVRVILNRAQPQVQPQQEPYDALDVAGARPLSGQSVLLVESDPVVRDTLMRVIEKLGAAVDGVGLAVDAVNAVNRNVYSAVVIDERMDSMSGYELAQMVRNEMPEDSGRVFIACAGSQDEAVRQPSRIDGRIEKQRGPKGVLDALME